MTLTIIFSFTSCSVDLDEDDGVKTMAAGSGHTVAIKNDGTLWAWGENYYGQLGDGTGNQTHDYDKSSPVQIETDTDWTAVFAGNDHTIAIKNNGTLRTWGRNSMGQLGDGSKSLRNKPVKLSGTDNDGKSFSEYRWIAASGGGSYTVAIKDDGTLWAWGYNDYGQLGDNSISQRSNPVPLSGTDNDGKLFSEYKWIAVATGTQHTVAIKDDGSLWTWGSNEDGKLGQGNASDGTPGDPTNSKIPIPVKINGNIDTDWISVIAGLSHTIALKKNGTLWAWGFNSLGQLGDGTTDDRFYPVQEARRDTDWASISGGVYHAIARKRNNTLWAWGDNQHGQLGLGYAGTKVGEPKAHYSPSRLGEAADLVGVSGGQYFSTALRRSGILWTWGINQYGQLGLGDTKNRPKPTAVKWE